MENEDWKARAEKAEQTIAEALFHMDEFSPLGLVEGVLHMGDRVWGHKGLSAVAKAQTAQYDAEQERDKYKKAKEENDERFMRERDDARARLEHWRSLKNHPCVLLKCPHGWKSDCALSILKEVQDIIKDDQ